MADHIVTGRSAAYRGTSEAVHHARTAREAREAAAYRMLAACGLGALIRRDYYDLFAFPPGARGALLDAGCGSGGDALELRRLAPGLQICGIDVSSVALSGAAVNPERGDIALYQGSLEQLPFPDASFDYIGSHEVIEHVEDPAVVLREFARVLKPGGVCVVTTPNGASLWIEHLRQRAMRLLGRRGAPVGDDHTRPPSFWRREFTRTGLAVERQLFDGAALEFQLFVAPARLMPLLSRTLEPLRVGPLLNLLLCDRVKFRLRKPGATPEPLRDVAPCCPVCRGSLSEDDAAATCRNGHRFARNRLRLVDFSALAAAPTPFPAGPGPDSVPPTLATAAEFGGAVGRPGWVQRSRRAALYAFGLGYAAGLLLLMPLGLLAGRWHQPLRR